MKNLFARMMSLLLVLCMVLSLAACGGESEQPSESETPTTETPSEPIDITPTGHNYVGGVCQDEGCGDKLVTENAVTYLSLSYAENFESNSYISVYDQMDGTCYVDYSGADRRVGSLDVEALNTLTFALEESGLLELVGKDAYEDGEASGSFYAEYADGSSVSASFSGVLPEAFVSGYAYVDGIVADLCSEIPVYVPQPTILGEINADDMAELQLIIDGAKLDNLDSYAISEVVQDEYFAAAVGLSSADGITRATSFSSTHMTTAYSVTILTLDDVATADAVCADLESSLDWRKWVCVAPSNGLIAVKDSMVLILLGSDALYTQTASAITEAGWTTARELTNPDLG